MSTNLDAKHIVDFLNDAHKADPAVFTTLFNVRRVCNKDLAEHPYVQVRGDEPDGPFWVTYIGIINGLLSSVHSNDLVAIKYDDKDNRNILGFTVTTREAVGLDIYEDENGTK